MELEELKGKALRKAKNKKWKETYKPNPTDPRCKWCNGELKYAFISRASTNRR